jgi:two-component system, chemotaxis family, CheB/CheR fusion protein
MPDDEQSDPIANEAKGEAGEALTAQRPEGEKPFEGQGDAEGDVEAAAEVEGGGQRAAGSEGGELEESERKASKLVVVGIGASAGGLEALGELVHHVPLDHMAFIVVQHLAPQHESVLAQLLARTSKINVVTAADCMTLEANHVYVIPPNTDLAVMHGVIHLLTPSSPSRPRLPIDYLFRSLAEDRGASAIGIVLSGTGTDGTLGLKAIKAAGGLTFVQEPSSAKYDGMPKSALESGAADFCLTPKEIGKELTRVARRPRAPRAAPAPHVHDQFARLFVLIRSEFGNDLAHYKPATVGRRIERRMALHQIERLDDYVQYVRSNRDELRALYKDMLITVTSFFRDPEAFEALKAKVFPPLLEQKGPGEPIRAWVPACATGEEAYSVAVSLLELCEARRDDVRVQVFGTDIDDDAVQYARRGVYPANVALDVAPGRLERFFVKKDNAYHVSRRVRDLVVFSKQNVLKDPPFSRIDLVSCRNLLIYLQPASQKQVLRLLHYALNPVGYLLLGTSETVGDASDLFSLVDRKSKIYLKKHLAVPVRLDVNVREPAPAEAPRHSSAGRPALSLQALADRKVLELYGPPGVVVNEDLEILQFRGQTGPYFNPAPGAASLNVLRLARFDFHVELRRAAQQALANQERVTTDVTYQDRGRPGAVRLDVVPLQDPETKARCLLVLFHPIALANEAAAPAGEAAPPARPWRELERELALTKEYLQTTLDERESANQALQSANEELQSTNEELQSTNEELQTSKEEMQSTNEELTTVNEELQQRMAELSQTNDDLHNVLAGVNHAVVIVGLDLKIRRYTAAAERLFNLAPGDVGRAIDFLDPFLGVASLGPKAAAVIESLSTVEEEVLAGNRRWYALKITPYKTLDHSIRGALVSMSDIDVRKRADDMARDVGAYAARFLAAIGHPLLIVDRKLRIVWANDSFFAAFSLAPEEAVGSLLPNVGRPAWADAGLRERLDGVFASGAIFRDYKMWARLHEAGERAMRVGGSLLPFFAETPLVLVSVEPADPISGGKP